VALPRTSGVSKGTDWRLPVGFRHRPFRVENRANCQRSEVTETQPHAVEDHSALQPSGARDPAECGRRRGSGRRTRGPETLIGRGSRTPRGPRHWVGDGWVTRRAASPLFCFVVSGSPTPSERSPRGPVNDREGATAGGFLAEGHRTDSIGTADQGTARGGSLQGFRGARSPAGGCLRPLCKA
jgi:hypothetical protein